MKIQTPYLPLTESAGRLSLLQRFARKQIFSQLNSLRHGNIMIRDAECISTPRSDRETDVVITVKDPRFYTEILFSGSNGAASSWYKAYWECNDLAKLFAIILRNQSMMDNIENGLAALGNWWLSLRHRNNANTKLGSQRNIHAHYDLGNDFFSMFLDESMTYSSGIFVDDNEDLHRASIEKLDRICRKLKLEPHHRIVEIGSGWGSFAIHAARYYGCHVTTTTISRAQYELARERIIEAGVEGQIELKLCDYRDIEGKFDRLVSIEMIEAVGHKYLPQYFAKCSELLKQDGQMLLQAITMPDQRYERYLRESDFIQQYIFPGSCVPSLSAIQDALRGATDLRIAHQEDFAEHYARTLRHWLVNFRNKRKEIRQLGYGDDFMRLWEYYLQYCEAGFSERYTGVVQLLMNKPENRAPSLLGEIVH